MLTVAVDAMGGDNAPLAIVEGVALALRAQADLAVELHGPKDRLQGMIPEDVRPRVTLVHAPAVITNHESPTAAIRQKADSSLVSALLSAKEGRAQAVLSAGSTGAVLAGGIFRLGRIRSVERPGLGPLLPTLEEHPVMLIDIGANVDCKPQYLQQFAVMGDAYMRAVMGVKQPRVALLNIGAEAEKGDELTQAAFGLLQQTRVHFVGNVEARDVLGGEVDVVVSDGFAGNVLLKSVEGTAMMMTTLLKRSIMSSARNKLGGLLIKPALRAFRRKLDYTEYGGAVLLGLIKTVVKAHGSSNARAICAAILQAAQIARLDVPALIATRLASNDASLTT